jgi:hypothetical protein
MYGRVKRGKGELARDKKADHKINLCDASCIRPCLIHLFSLLEFGRFYDFSLAMLTLALGRRLWACRLFVFACVTYP